MTAGELFIFFVGAILTSIAFGFITESQANSFLLFGSICMLFAIGAATMRYLDGARTDGRT